MFDNVGTCQCEKVHVTISLPTELVKYEPRQCDCDFCSLKELSYISDPNGELKIESEYPMKILKQGSNQASFLVCAFCETVVAVSIQTTHSAIGALNANLLKNFNLLQKPIVVSPKRLVSEEKLSRWKDNWGSIQINGVSLI